MVDVSCLSFVLFFLCHIRLPFFPSCRPQSVPNNNRNNKKMKPRKYIESTTSTYYWATTISPLSSKWKTPHKSLSAGRWRGCRSRHFCFVFGVVAWSWLPECVYAQSDDWQRVSEREKESKDARVKRVKAAAKEWKERKREILERWPQRPSVVDDEDDDVTRAAFLSGKGRKSLQTHPQTRAKSQSTQ